MANSKYRVGQVWNFKTSPTQPNAKLIILRTEDGGELGTIVHIALTDVNYGNGNTTISHLPFAESSIERSVTALASESGKVPDFAEGYRIWREAFDAGKGGVFTITVAEAIDAVVSTMPKQ